MDKKKILIVGDERSTLFIVEKGLAMRGYYIITANSCTPLTDSVVMSNFLSTWQKVLISLSANSLKAPFKTIYI